MTLDYQRRLRPLLLPLLPLRLLTLLFFLSFSWAQNSTSNDTAPVDAAGFALVVQPTLFVCENASLSWSGADTKPLYEVYLARGQGAIGDDSSLEPEQWIAAVGGTSLEWLVRPVWASPGDVLRFRVQDNYGKGINSTTAWSTVEGTHCTRGTAGLTPHIGPTSFIVSIHTVPDVTTKNTNINTANGDMMPTLRPVVSDTRNVVSPSRSPSASSPTSPVGQNSNQSPSTPVNGTPGSDTGTKSPGQGSGQDNSGDVGGATTNQSQPATLSVLGGEQVPQSTKAAVPNNASGQSDTASKEGGKLSSQAIGAIVGTIIIATALWLFFVLWRRRRRRRVVALSPGQSPFVGSTRELLTPSSETSAIPERHPAMAEAPVYPRHGRQKLAPPLSTRADLAGYEGATVPSYDEATGLYSPLVTPDPFRNSFNISPAQGNIRSQPG